MKHKLLILAAAAFMLIETSCRTTVVAEKPAHRHYWAWHHPHTQKEVIIVR